MDKDLCLEIAQALTDSFVSNATAPNASPNLDHKQESTCSCSKQGNK